MAHHTSRPESGVLSPTAKDDHSPHVAQGCVRCVSPSTATCPMPGTQRGLSVRVLNMQVKAHPHGLKSQDAV